MVRREAEIICVGLQISLRFVPIETGNESGNVHVVANVLFSIP